ncbi:MAG TPA: carboxypeptidase regulatory-like domain-containing protein, partial [Thermoplasmatales archaeon]|nr:carboxypeptidase regulatory-like domain-containing protein [Thermoplasmatales archaeon]
MVSKKPVTMLFISIIILSFIPIFPQSAASGIESLPFKQAITVPIDTSWDEAKHQPIDIRIEFTNPCWAKNETLHSVRVCYDDGTGLTEIESQIYGLEFIDNSHIKACNLVFLIPAEANGKEKYYVLYDDSETPPPNYPDHLKVEDT